MIGSKKLGIQTNDIICFAFDFYLLQFQMDFKAAIDHVIRERILEKHGDCAVEAQLQQASSSEVLTRKHRYISECFFSTCIRDF